MNTGAGEGTRRGDPGPCLVYANCTIYADRLDHRAWSNYFRTDPDFSVVKGMPFRTPSGRMSTGVGRTGVWGCSTEDSVQTDELDPHLQHLVTRLRLPRLDLPEMLRRNEAWMRAFCYWFNATGNRIPAIDPRIRQAIESSGIIIEIDEYPLRS